MRLAGWVGLLCMAISPWVTWAQPQWEEVAFDGMTIKAIYPSPHQGNVLFVTANRPAPVLMPGLFKSTDWGQTWHLVSDTSRTGYTFAGLSFHPTSPDTILASTRAFSNDSYLWSTDGGESWVPRTTSLEIQFAEGWLSPAYNYARANEVLLDWYTSFDMVSRIYRSSDGGTAFDSAMYEGGSIQWVRTFTSHPQEIFVEPEGPRSTNGGLTWRSLADSVLVPLFIVEAAANPEEAFYIRVNYSRHYTTEPHAVLGRLEEGDQTWSEVLTFPYGIAFRSALAVYPSDARRAVVYNLCSQYPDTVITTLQMTTDGGATWTSLTDAPFWGDEPWVNDLKYSSDGRYLFAALAGRPDSVCGGLWRAEAAGSADAKPEIIAEYSLSVYPNPFNPDARISYTVQKAGRVELKVYDLTGRWVRTLSDEMQAAGTHEVRFEGNGLASGTYFVRLTAGEVCRTEKMLLLR